MSQPKLGIIAGGGPLPGRLIEACKASGREIFVVALKGHADPEAIGDAPQIWTRLGAVGKAEKAIREAGVREVVMIGPVRRPSIREIRPDLRAAEFLFKVGMKALGDDSLLSAIVEEFENSGFKVIGAHTILPELLAPEGVWGEHGPDERAQTDIARGIEVAKGIGALDVGQSVVVQQGIVLGVEAVEGTDALIRRCGPLHRRGPGGVLVKMTKPEQDWRVDLPTIGTQTVAEAARAKLRGIAVQAGGTIVVDRPQVVEEANRRGLFVMGVTIDP